MMRSVLYLLLELVLIVSSGPQNISEVKPTSYTLSFTFYLESERYLGNTDIEFDLLKPDTSITLHAQDLRIIRVLLYEGEGRKMVPVRYRIDFEDKLILLRVDRKSFSKSTYYLRVQFASPLKRELNGIYLTEYTDENGILHQIVASHFEPNNARKAFPCFDKPSLKAKFSISVDHSAKFGVISNMPTKKHRYVRSETIRTEFIPTPPMSTYLVALILSDYEYENATTSRGVQIRAFYRPGRRSEVLTGLSSVVQSIEYFETYLVQCFPLPKLDIVPLPDFSIGAMENWGLITIRDQFFYNSRQASVYEEIVTRAIIAHEVAHMWFGDLVTIASWNDLWLKEGVAQVLMFSAVNSMANQNMTEDDIKVALNMFSRYIPLAIDSGRTTHPVSMNINDTDSKEAAAAFDSISYSKSSTLLEMLKSVEGDEAFRSGISTYVTKFKYKSATLNDFLTVMNTIGRFHRSISLQRYMNTWLTLPGYPVVKLITLSKTTYRLLQSRFVNEPNYDYKREDTSRWPVLITITTDRGFVYETLLQRRSMLISFNFEPRFIKLNVNETGFFRTNYDPDSLRNIINQLEMDHTRFTENERAGLVSDVLNMALVNKCPVGSALDILKYFGKEKSYIIWNEALKELHKMSYNLGKEILQRYERFMVKLLSPAYDKYATSQKTLNDRSLSDILGYYGMIFKIPTVIVNARSAFEKWIQNKDGPINRNIMIYGVRDLGMGELVWRKFISTPYPKKDYYYHSLAASKSIDLIQKLLKGSLVENWVPLQNKYEILTAVSQYHPGTALQFLMDNYSSYFKLYGETQFNFSNIFKAVIGNIKTKEDFDKAYNFFSSVDLGAALQAYKLALDEAKSTLSWKDCCESELNDYLKGLGL